MWPAHDADVRVQYAILPSGLRLRVAEQGPWGRPPVLLLHGWGASAYMYRGLMSSLAAAGFHAIAPDLRGHGLSDKPAPRHGAYATERMVDDVGALVRLFCPGRLSIVGQSMGGAIALRLASMLGERVERVAVIAPAGLVHSHAISVGRWWARFVPSRLAPRLATRPVTAAALRACYAKPARITPMQVDEYWGPSQYKGYARALRSLLLRFDWGPYPDELLAAITAPTLVIDGTADRIIPGSAAGASRIPHGSALVVDDAGHLANAEQPTVVNQAIVEFLAGGESAAAGRTA